MNPSKVGGLSAQSVGWTIFQLNPWIEKQKAGQMTRFLFLNRVVSWLRLMARVALQDYLFESK
jgi:hypothetical protein